MLYTICSVVYLHIPWTSMDQKRRFSSRHGPASRKAKRWHSSPPTYWVIDGLMISNHKKSIHICVNYLYIYIHTAHLSLYMYTCMMLYIYIDIVYYCITLCTVKPLFKNPLHRWIAGCTPIMLLEIRTLGYPRVSCLSQGYSLVFVAWTKSPGQHMMIKRFPKSRQQTA